jgi:ribosomal protein S18 acetylase RimI-like enzyme
VAVEPGRWLVANPGVTLYRVAGRKRTPDGSVLIAVDGGMSDNLRPALYGARHPVLVASARRDGVPLERVTVVGRNCESGDELARGVELPAGLERGDLLGFGATGAYAYPLASAYNRFGRPAVVAVEDGRATPWLRREDAADMDRLEIPARRGLPAAPPGISIRPARPSDAVSFLEHWRAIVAEGRWIRSERVEHAEREYRRRFRRASTPDAAQLVALEDDRVIGHVAIARETHEVARHVATLGMAVSPDRRHGGVGRALLAEAFRWAARHGIEKLVLSVYPENRAAIALYASFGFIQEGRLARHSRKSYGDEDEILMAAWIGTER